MKRKITLKSLLMMATLIVGSGNAWGVEVTTTYDFSEGTAGTTPTIASSAHHKAGNTTNVFLATDDICKSRFCFQAVDNSNNVFNYKNGKLQNLKGDRWMSVVDLKAGDKIVFTFNAATAGSSKDKFFTVQNAGSGSTTNLSLTQGGDALDANTDMVSETSYYVLADGYVDFKTRKNFYLSKVEVTTQVSEESVTAPTITLTGANAGSRTVTIKSGESNLGSDITTYYTIDGSTPTGASDSSTEQYTSVVVGSGATEAAEITVKAISVSSSSTSSEVTSLVVPVGTTIQLDAPTIAMTGMTLNGTVYNPVFTLSAPQTVIGEPTATVSYTFNGGDAVTADTYTLTAAGTLTVTATAEGYEANSTVFNFDNADYLLTNNINLAADNIDVSSFGDGNANAHWANFGSMSTTLYTLPEVTSLPGVTLNSVSYSQFGLGYGLGFASGTRTVSVNGAVEGQIGEYILYTSGKLDDEHNQSVFVNFDNGITYTVPTTGNSKALKMINVYSPASAPATISTSGYATFVAPYALDFTGTKVTAYIVEESKINSGYVTLTQVNAVPAGTALIISGETDDIPVTTGETDDVSGNKLVAGTGEAVTGYVLVKRQGEDKPLFAWSEGTATVASSQAYLQIEKVADARELLIGFGEATGIKAVDNFTISQSDNCYDLSGRRVVKSANGQMTKGLYIVNGKKYVVK